MKSWLLCLIVIGVCVGTLGWVVRDKVLPFFLASANQECVADWHAALTECRQETGSWPDPADTINFPNQVFVIKSSDGRRVDRGYMTGRPWSYSNGIMYDAYGQPLRVTRDGEHLVVSSSGANRLWGDGMMSLRPGEGTLSAHHSGTGPRCCRGKNPPQKAEVAPWETLHFGSVRLSRCHRRFPLAWL